MVTNSVAVDIVKENDEILIYEHYSGDLIFEYNPADSSAYQEFNDLWGEVRGSERLR